MADNYPQNECNVKCVQLGIQCETLLIAYVTESELKVTITWSTVGRKGIELGAHLTLCDTRILKLVPFYAASQKIFVFIGVCNYKLEALLVCM